MAQFLFGNICVIKAPTKQPQILFFENVFSSRPQNPAHNLRELVCNSRNPDPRRVSKGGSELRPMTPFPRIPRIPRIKFRLQNGMSNFVRRRGAQEPYLSKPSRPPFKFDALKSRGFVYAKRSFSQTVVVLFTRDAHFQKNARRDQLYTQTPDQPP